MTNLTLCRTRVLNTLRSTNEKFEDDIVDEAIRRILDEYSQAFPDVRTAIFPLLESGRAQLLVDCKGLLAVQQLILPYQWDILDPLIDEREDFYVFFHQSQPYVYFTGFPVPLAGQLVSLRFACRHTMTELDDAADTTVRPDHESMLVLGAAGAAATSRAAGTIEQWGGRASDPNQLMLWGQAQYQKFREFLLTIRADQSQSVFPRSYWPLDGEDGHVW
ncbi:MAG: hypothetical protein GYA45_04820 [Pelolinea sp.]|jgi:hypothetical protein|nr:hypothetical protein [Pelolinea sp.]